MRELRVEDAILYFDQVKREFLDRPHIYNEFVSVMNKFKTQQIDTPGVMRRVSTLFQGNKRLVLGFNQFIPEGYKIEIPVDGDGPTIAVYRVPGQSGVTHILGPAEPGPAPAGAAAEQPPPAAAQQQPQQGAARPPQQQQMHPSQRPGGLQQHADAQHGPPTQQKQPQHQQPFKSQQQQQENRDMMGPKTVEGESVFKASVEAIQQTEEKHQVEAGPDEEMLGHHTSGHISKDAREAAPEAEKNTMDQNVSHTKENRDIMKPTIAEAEGPLISHSKASGDREDTGIAVTPKMTEPSMAPHRKPRNDSKAQARDETPATFELTNATVIDKRVVLKTDENLREIASPAVSAADPHCINEKEQTIDTVLMENNGEIGGRSTSGTEPEVSKQKSYAKIPGISVRQNSQEKQKSESDISAAVDSEMDVRQYVYLAGMELEAQPAQTPQRRTISSKRSGSDAGVDDQAGDPDGSGPRKRSRKSAQDDMELETVVVVPRKQRPRRKTVSSKRSGSNTGIGDQAGDTHGSGPRRRSLKSDEAAENVRHIGTTEKVVSEVWQSDDNDNNDLDYALEARNTMKFAKKQKTDSQSSKMKSLGKKPVEEDDQSLSVDEIDAEVLQDFERKTPHWTKERKRRRREMEANDQQPVIQKTDALESIRTDASEEGVVFKKVPPSEGGEVDGAEADDIMRSSPPQLTMESHTEIDTSSSAAIQPSALKTQPESTELGTSPSLAAQLSPSRVEQQNLTTQTSSSSLSWEWSWRIVPQSHGFTPMLWKGSLVAGYRKMDTTTEVTRRRLQEEQFKKKYPHHLLPYSMWESLQERGLITSKDTKESLGQLRARRESLIEQYSIAFTKLTNFTTERMHANRVDNMRMRLDEYEACLLDVNYAITRLTGEQPKEEFTKPVYDPETTHSEETEPEVTIGPVVGIQEVRTEHESEPEWYKHIVELENHSEEEKTEREPTKPAPLEMEMFLRRFMAFRQHLARMRESVERQCTSAKTKLWKMRIRRNNLCHDVLQHFDKASKVKMFQKTRVTFADSNDIDEIGVDEGGLTEEMYTEFFKQFPSYGLFEDAEGAATLLPRPDAPQKELFALGRLLCKCILDDHPIGYKIGYVVFHVLIGSYDQYGVDEALDALRTWDPDLASSYCKLLKTTDSSEGLTLNNFDANLNETEVTKENIGEAVRSGSRRRLVYDRKVSWKALKGGFLFEYADLELQLGVFSRKELVHMLHGKHEYLTSQDIVESIIWPDAATESHLYGRAKVLVYLRELLESEIDFDSDCRMSFLQWCTGLVAIPCNGLRQKISLRVYQGATNGSLPVVQTCTREILLPPYSSKEQLKQKLLLAIQHCNDGFQLE